MTPTLRTSGGATVRTRTGTPVPGGFSTHELIDLICRLVSRRRILGVDIVELIGEGEGAHRSALAAAEVLARTLDAAFMPSADRPSGMESSSR
ncbi:arginase family protein [Curtobacterium sp. Curtsp57]|uniref:arginase family protein n=1 Tax=Curtobacterium sp. Curtsp57 TaxID=3243047 RepID=UPI0039B42114